MGWDAPSSALTPSTGIHDEGLVVLKPSPRSPDVGLHFEALALGGVAHQGLVMLIPCAPSSDARLGLIGHAPLTMRMSDDPRAMRSHFLETTSPTIARPDASIPVFSCNTSGDAAKAATAIHACAASGRIHPGDRGIAGWCAALPVVMGAVRRGCGPRRQGTPGGACMVYRFGD